MIKPLVDKVLLKVDEPETITSSGLLIAGNKEDPDTATVIAVGNGVTLSNGNTVAIPVNVGDKVIFSKYAGTEVSDGGQEYLLVAYKDILAVIEND